MSVRMETSQLVMWSVSLLSTLVLTLPLIPQFRVVPGPPVDPLLDPGAVEAAKLMDIVTLPRGIHTWTYLQVC